MSTDLAVICVILCILYVSVGELPRFFAAFKIISRLAARYARPYAHRGSDPSLRNEVPPAVLLSICYIWI